SSAGGGGGRRRKRPRREAGQESHRLDRADLRDDALPVAGGSGAEERGVAAGRAGRPSAAPSPAPQLMTRPSGIPPLKRDDFSSNRHRAFNFLLEHDVFPKSGAHFSASCSRHREYAALPGTPFR